MPSDCCGACACACETKYIYETHKERELRLNQEKRDKEKNIQQQKVCKKDRIKKLRAEIAQLEKEIK
jgi:hypothetical protein